MPKKHFKRDYNGAVFLLFLGTMFLLNTTGLIGWGIWLHILKFWPVFLILGGLKLILEGSRITEILLIVLTILSYSLLGFLAYTSYTNQEVPFLPYSITRYLRDTVIEGENAEEFTKDGSFSVLKDAYSNIEKRILDINIATSTVNILDDTDENYLVVKGDYDSRDVKPSAESNFVGGILTILFNTGYNQNFATWKGISPVFDLSIGQHSIPTDISMEIGAGEGNLTLRKLTTEKVSAKVGAGKLNIDLQEDSIPQEITVEIGAGEISLKLPADIGFDLSYSLGIGEISYNGKEIATFSGKNNSYKSSNYDSAEKIIKITAAVGVGQLKIENN